MQAVLILNGGKKGTTCMKKVFVSFLVACFCLGLVGCANLQTNEERGTAYGAGAGAATGAVLGQAIGKNTQSTLIGAGIGALIGGLAGNQIGQYMDRQEQELRQAIAASEAASIRREEDVLRATFKGEAYFDFDKSELKPAAVSELRRISVILNKYPQTIMEVAGHTDTQGAADYNQRLSERRAEAVKAELIRNGVMPQRITAVGYGESRPISSSDSMNRRVEIIILPIRNG